jgi:putative acetyltransferase
MTRIRVATPRDRENIREVYLRAFPEGESRIVAALAINLLTEETRCGTITLVAEMDGTVAGHIAFSPVTVENNGKWKGFILAPLGVKPDCQGRRIGTELIKSGMRRLSGDGVDVLFVYGDPGYYGKFGFNADTASGYLPPYKLQYPFAWQAIALNDRCPAASTVKIACVASLSDPDLW